MYIKTPEDTDSPIDAVLVDSEGVIRGAVETRCRYAITYPGFKDVQERVAHNNVKVISAADVAKGLRVPLVGFLYLVEDQTLLVQRITDRKEFLRRHSVVRQHRPKQLVMVE